MANQEGTKRKQAGEEEEGDTTHTTKKLKHHQHTLPPELLEHVFSFLLSYTNTLCLVSAQWNNLILESHLLWKLNLLRRFNFKVSNNVASQQALLPKDYYHSLFREMSVVEQNWDKGICTIEEIDGHFGRVCALQFDKIQIITGSEDKSAKLFDIGTGQCLRTFYGHSETVWSLKFNHDRNILCTGSGDSTIKLWSLDTASCVRTIKAHKAEVWSLSLDGGLLASGSVDSVVKLWDIETGVKMLELFDHSSCVFSVQLCGNILASSSRDGKVKLTDIRIHDFEISHSNIATLRCPVASPLFCTQFDEKEVVAGSGDGSIKVFDRMTNTLRGSVFAHHDSVWCLQMDQNKIVSGGVDKKICVTQRATDTTDKYSFRYAMQSHMEPVFVLQFDESKLVTADDTIVQIWNFGNNKICNNNNPNNTSNSTSSNSNNNNVNNRSKTNANVVMPTIDKHYIDNNPLKEKKPAATPYEDESTKLEYHIF